VVPDVPHVELAADLNPSRTVKPPFHVEAILLAVFAWPTAWSPLALGDIRQALPQGDDEIERRSSREVPKIEIELLGASRVDVADLSARSVHDDALVSERVAESE
jgi:hypothetical protein